MIHRLFITLFVTLPIVAVPAGAAESLAELTEQVRATEIAFAKTLADRDVGKFRAMIAPDAIWLGNEPARGPDAIVRSWQKYFDAAKPPFSWKPEIVEVQEGGRLALSTGPVLDPNGKQVGVFTSIWRREADGQWKNIFDRGCPACEACARN